MKTRKADGERDARELALFMTYLRLVSEAMCAGVPMCEAAKAIYPDLYEKERP